MALYQTITKYIPESEFSDFMSGVEQKALLRFSKTNSLADLPQSALNKIHNSLAALRPVHPRAVLEFNRDVARFYTSKNLSKFSDRLRHHFSAKSWASWINEEVSMSEGSLTHAYNIVGLEMYARPSDNAKAVPVPCITDLRAALQANDDAIQLVADKITDSLETTNEYTLHISDESVTIKISAHLYKVRHGDYAEGFSYAEEAVEAAYQLTQKLGRDKLKSMATKRPVATKPEPALKKAVGKHATKKVAGKANPGQAFLKLQRELKNTDWDGQPNFSSWSDVSKGDKLGVEFFDGDKEPSYRIVVTENVSMPYRLSSGETFASPISALKHVMQELALDADDVVDDEEDEKGIKKEGVKPAGEQLDIEDEEEYVDDSVEEENPLFTEHALARCPALDVFNLMRKEYLHDAEGDMGDVSSLYGVLASIARHSFTRIVSEYWTSSFAFDVLEDDEDDAVFEISCADFSVRITAQAIEIKQYHGKNGNITFAREFESPQSITGVLNTALGYFDTWGSDRIEQTLEKVGFAYGDSLRTHLDKVLIAAGPDQPNSFFEPVPDLCQVTIETTAYKLSEFLRDETRLVRGVILEEDGSSDAFVLKLFDKLFLKLHSASGRGHNETILIAEAKSAHEFFASMEQDEEFDLDTLRNHGMVVRTSDERTMLSFNQDSSSYIVHIYN